MTAEQQSETVTLARAHAALSDAQARLVSLRAEQSLLESRKAEALKNGNDEDFKKLRERERALPDELHLAKVKVARREGDYIAAQEGPLAEVTERAGELIGEAQRFRDETVEQANAMIRTAQAQLDQAIGSHRDALGAQQALRDEKARVDRELRELISRPPG